MTTPLQKINKKAHSASSINKFIAQPASWVMSYVYGVYGSGSPAMSRGKAAEVGYDHYINGGEFGGSLEGAVSAATRYYNKDTALQGCDEAKREKERNALHGFIEQTVEAFEPFGFPTSSQNKLELVLDGVADPFIGYDDYCFAPQGDDPRPISIDLKTTHRLPSDISDAHKRQLSLYQAMKPDHKIMIAYCTPKKNKIFTLDNDEAAEILNEIKSAAQTVERLLAIYDDPKELKGLYAPDFSSFYWSDPISRTEAKRIWGY